VRGEPHGGLVLGAFADGELVGEAGYSLMDNGNGTFALTLDEARRGWLGPFLFDHLLAAARDRGVPNLEGDIRLDNKPMLALARSRGLAMVDHPDWTQGRVVIGTGGRVPGWPRRPEVGGRPRLLVEAPSGRWPGEAEAKEAGLEVIVCPGPPGRPGRRCPLLAGEPCPLVEGADAIVVAGSGEDYAALARHHRSAPAGTPVVVRNGDAPTARQQLDRVLALFEATPGPEVCGDR
jgi:GNAT superfamily N-acetyltransferase